MILGKRAVLAGGALIAIALTVVGMSAYEAHIINVTAHIENALTVDTTEINFGTVFPQEALDENFDIGLSMSFLNQARVSQVDYVIRQKPKCYSPSLKLFGRVEEGENGEFVCADGGDYAILPMLCPYLSKHELTTDGAGENDSLGINAFHGPITNWQLADTINTQVMGKLALTDPADTWQIDLRVPCFTRQCAQDWPAFVLANNPQASPSDYILPASLEHELFGCDLWIEVTGIGAVQTCTPNCDDKQCGDDGCGGSCGTCTADEICTNYRCLPYEYLCADGVDNDGDVLTDCADPDCASNPACQSINNETICNDGVDNDGDTLIDCADPDCTADPACQVTPICGNGFIEGSEGCDDGSNSPDDGCSSACQIEPGWYCIGQPSICTPVCGDGLVANGEICDDGNTNAGDGCGPDCQTEPGYKCAGEPSVCAVPDLFFSEYIEGNSSNKALEIYNPTDIALNLSGYKIELYMNGNTSPLFTIGLNGFSLNPGGLLIVCNDSAAPDILSICDLQNGNLAFNGDDAIVLKNSAEAILDVIGKIGEQPLPIGSGYWGTGGTTTKDHTLIRKCEVIKGDSNGTDNFYPALEWDGYEINYFGDLGTHTVCY